jgi:hypothetical protein
MTENTYRKCLDCDNIFIYADYCPKCRSRRIIEIDFGDENTKVEVRRL